MKAAVNYFLLSLLALCHETMAESMEKWSVVFESPSVNTLFSKVVTAPDSSMVFALSNTAIFQSNDDGKSWETFADSEKLKSKDSYYSAVACSLEGDIVYYSAYGDALYVHNSTGDYQVEQANNWTAMATNDDGKYVYALTGNSDVTGGFWRSVTYGDVWAAQWYTSQRPYNSVATDHTGKVTASKAEVDLDKTMWIDLSYNYGSWGYVDFVNGFWDSVFVVNNPYAYSTTGSYQVYATQIGDLREGFYRATSQSSTLLCSLYMGENITVRGGDVVSSTSGQFVFFSALNTGDDCDSSNESCGMLYQSFDCGTTWSVLFDHGEFFHSLTIGANNTLLYGSSEDGKVYQYDMSFTVPLIGDCPR